MKLFGFFILFLLPGSSRENEDCVNFTRLVYSKPGNITITGVFDGYAGENCTELVEFGLEEMAAAVWTTTALDRYNYIPGMKIGLSLFDSCGTAKMAQEAFAEAIVHESCRNGTNIGLITTAEIDAKLKTLSQKVNKTITRLEHLLDLDGLLNIVSQLLTNLHWTTVNRVISDTRSILDIFSRKMSDEGICIYDEVLSDMKYSVSNKILEPADTRGDIISKDPPVIVVICKSDEISRIFSEMTEEMRLAEVKWLLVPTDFTLDVPSSRLPEKVFSILPLVSKKDALHRFLTDEEMQKDLMNHRGSTRSPLFVKIAVGILELLSPFKNSTNETSCTDLTKLVDGKAIPETLKITPERITNALSVLKIDGSDNEPFLYMATLMGRDKAEDGAIFQVFDLKTKEIKPVPLIVNERLFNERRGRRGRQKRTKIFKINADDLERMKKREEVTEYPSDFLPYRKHPCVSILDDEDNNLTRSCGVCQNLIRYYARFTKTTEKYAEEVEEAFWSWRYRNWVAINASVASIGILCTFAVIIFIIFRICKGDILEGSPFFSFLILILIIILYLSTLPFSIEAGDSDLICWLRILAPSLSYSVLFSVILSRSLMLIFSERDGGIMSHVNGCLQSILCFFMCIVQIALTIQFWAFGPTDCLTTLEHNFTLLLVYGFFLLLLLAVAAPFTIKSKRNYKEGRFFSIATLLVSVVWCVWISFYYILPVKDRDAAIALGLTATATAVLLSVFIPRTYLMVTATVRDKINNTLPNLAYINASNVSEINYRSDQALYDPSGLKLGTPKLDFSTSRIYNVQTCNSAPASPNNYPNGVDYMLNRRKTFIETARLSPENSYVSHESDPTGKITRF